MSIRLITFKTNQTLLADVKISAHSSNIYSVVEPVQVIVQPSPKGPMMGFVPFLDYSKEFKTGIEINVSDVLCVTEPTDELRNEYSRLFGSGIQIPTESVFVIPRETKC